MTIKAIYIDDEIEQPYGPAQKIQELLQIPNVFEVNLRLPPASFSELSNESLDLLIIDLDLRTAEVGGNPISYFGSTLAAEMRMRPRACPLVLITRPQPLAESGKLLMLEESADLDLILLKDDVIKNPEDTRRKLIALVKGFKELEQEKGQEWQRVLDLLGANEDERNLLRESGPPLAKGQWNVPSTARWVRNTLMRFPGIMYDELTSATRLGISLEAFYDPEVQNLMKPAKYTGIFSDYHPRWWRNRLFDIALKLMLEQGLRGAPSQEFGKAFKSAFGKELPEAICVYDGTGIADWVCYILQQPVKQSNSIPYYPDTRPSIMDQARVSFKAITTSPDFDERLVDADCLPIVESLWEGDN